MPHDTEIPAIQACGVLAAAHGFIANAERVLCGATTTQVGCAGSDWRNVQPVMPLGIVDRAGSAGGSRKLSTRTAKHGDRGPDRQTPEPGADRTVVTNQRQERAARLTGGGLETGYVCATQRERQCCRR